MGDIANTFGALLLGGLFAAMLSGVVTIQVIVYFKLYPTDPRYLKSFVLGIWLLDTCHTGFIWAALWEYIIEYFGDASKIDFIPWNIASTIVLTAILTFLVHGFSAHQIFKLSHRNWYLTAPIIVLAVLRLVSACATTGEMIRLHSFSEFKEHYWWLFTLGLALSSAVDIIITVCMFLLLQTSRTGSASLKVVVDSLVRYTFETGFLTCAGTIVSMLCWLTMRDNLIFMGLHFVISKLYSTSLLVTLNTRDTLRRARLQPSSDREFPTVLRLDTRGKKNTDSTDASGQRPASHDFTTSKAYQTKLEINVERSVQRDAGDGVM
ncbi:hypothetical protein Hypma_011297 [Hypsizygus marmoreus]|uniref:DUF6534 domain-containing protein n=1 Tax=Hypsizygus marmoreus TaxID=39966 RepID=A0A369JK49_HYPMA|nr:hypothetical protein Hypma_011297 [Hypsizygus marmoreus]